MKYTIKETVLDLPWRYFVYKDGYAVGLTLTKWGANRLIRKLKKVDERNSR